MTISRHQTARSNRDDARPGSKKGVNRKKNVPLLRINQDGSPLSDDQIIEENAMALSEGSDLPQTKQSSVTKLNTLAFPVTVIGDCVIFKAQKSDAIILEETASPRPQTGPVHRSSLTQLIQTFADPRNSASIAASRKRASAKRFEKRTELHLPMDSEAELLQNIRSKQSMLLTNQRQNLNQKMLEDLQLAKSKYSKFQSRLGGYLKTQSVLSFDTPANRQSSIIDLRASDD